ncbi:hypothetical protein BGW38_007309 [Lunasporangiospora selenospora]|uniref:Uncharacterized protein n=1 Tax=Lunasporangiospora selenospora TaxID=979761 RepID=A0A9P6KGM3_9FUNG|nr:hypothetical protein BGW38_007309 [Lunasporangiospora selenospora]
MLTILGTIDLKKVSSEESEEILRQWIGATILDRKKFGLLSTELRDYTSKLSSQYEECRKLLADFNLEKKRSQNDLMEKFRALINTKKTKIGKLAKTNETLQGQIKDLEKALKDERQQVAMLQGQKSETSGSDSVQIKAKKEAGGDISDGGPGSSRSGRGKYHGRGQGRRKVIAGIVEDEPVVKTEHGADSHPESKTKKLDRRSKASHKQDAKSADDDLVPYMSLPHPQDDYGWDEEDSVTECPRNDPKGGLSSSTGLSAQETANAKRHLDDLSGGAQKLLERVSKATTKHSGSSTKEEANLAEPAILIKQEVSVTESRSLLRRRRDPSSEGAQERQSPEGEEENLTRSTKKKQRLESGGVSPLRSGIGESRASKVASTTTESSPESTPRTRSRYPVFAMRKAGAAKVEAPKQGPVLSTTSPNTSLRSTRSNEGPVFSTDHKRTRVPSNPDSGIKKAALTRSDSHRRQKDGGGGVAPPSIISVEELYKELE